MILDYRIKWIERFKRRLNHYHNGIKGCKKSQRKHASVYSGNPKDYNQGRKTKKLPVPKPRQEAKSKLLKAKRLIRNLEKGILDSTQAAWYLDITKDELKELALSGKMPHFKGNGEGGNQRWYDIDILREYKNQFNDSHTKEVG